MPYLSARQIVTRSKNLINCGLRTVSMLFLFRVSYFTSTLGRPEISGQVDRCSLINNRFCRGFPFKLHFSMIEIRYFEIGDMYTVDTSLFKVEQHQTYITATQWLQIVAILRRKPKEAVPYSRGLGTCRCASSTAGAPPPPR